MTDLAFIRPRKQDARQPELRPVAQHRALDTSPMPHWVRPPDDARPRTDMSWLTEFVPPPPGWVPAVDLHGYTEAGWEWCITSQPHSDMLQVVMARVGDRCRAGEAADTAAAARWIEGQST